MKVSEKHEVKNIAKPEEKREFPNGRIEMVTVGGTTIGKFTLQPGWKWSTSVKPIVNTPSCQVWHLGYQLSGVLHVRMDDGTEFDIRPGDAVSLPPNHDAWVVGNEPVVTLDIKGGPEYAKR